MNSTCDAGLYFFWIIKPSRRLLGLMINKCFLNTQILNPPAMQVRIFFFNFYLIQTSLIREIKKKSRDLTTGFYICAHDWIRTSTPNGTTPSRWHVYQFHHVGII